MFKIVTSITDFRVYVFHATLSNFNFLDTELCEHSFPENFYLDNAFLIIFSIRKGYRTTSQTFQPLMFFFCLQYTK